MIKDLCFEIIQKCTNNCKFCSSCVSIDKTNIISFELFKSVIDFLMNQEDIKEISISGGEPFLHTELLETEIRMGVPLSDKQDHLCTAGYKVFSIKDNLHKLKGSKGFNKCALCKKVYE